MQPFIKKIKTPHDDWRTHGIFVYGKNRQIYLISWHSSYASARERFRVLSRILHLKALRRNNDKETVKFKYTSYYGFTFNIIGERKSNAKTSRRTKVHD